MSQKLAKMTAVAALAVSLSGCAQMSKLSDNMWGYTKSAANFVASPISKMLRSAPEPHYVFEDSSRAQQMAQTAFATDGRAEMFSPAHRSKPQTPHYQYSDYVPKSYQVVQDIEASRVDRVAAARPQMSPKTPQDISFVKMGGGSNMQDWLMCEAEAGGFIRVIEGGYLIEPGFESCMRGKGYKPESEVADQLSPYANDIVMP